MERTRRLLLGAVSALVAVPVALAVAQTTAAPEQQAAAADQQSFFTTQLQNDTKTSAAIKRLLRSKAGFVDSRSGFVDLTGDGKPDAIVLVTIPGAAGTVALYVFSTDGGSDHADTKKLHAVLRSQQLYRATFKIRSGTLVVRTPAYAAGDEPQAPSAFEERDYYWAPSTATMRRVARRTIKGPGAAPASAEGDTPGGTPGAAARR